MPHRLLLVEDNPDTVEFLIRRLREAGYEVVIARNGLEALRQVEELLPACVILDINLPLLNGDDLARRMRADPRTARVPIIFVTAESEERVRDLLEPQHTLCLEKAIKFRSLVAALTDIGLPPRTPEPRS